MSKVQSQLKNRNRKRTTNRGQYTQEQVNEAVNLVLNEDYKVRAVARLKNIPHKTLDR